MAFEQDILYFQSNNTNRIQSTSSQDINKPHSKSFSYTPEVNRKDFQRYSENNHKISYEQMMMNTRRQKLGVGITENLIKRRSRSIPMPLDTHILYRTDDSKKDILKSRVEKFLTKEVPGKPPTSLRYLKPKPDKISLNFNIPKHSTSPINTSSCPNLHMFSDRSSWSYNYKVGKCRYLRCPPSPVLQPHEIFSR